MQRMNDLVRIECTVRQETQGTIQRLVEDMEKQLVRDID